MPRKSAVDDEMPRRRRGARAVAVEEERGLLLRIFLHSPKDVLAGLLAVAAISAIVTNALFLQAGRHPSPMFGATAGAPAHAVANPLPRPRPVEATTRSIELTSADLKAAEPRVEPKAEKAESKPEPKSDEMKYLVTKAAPAAPPATAAPAPAPVAAPSAAVMRPPAPVPVATPHTAAGRKIAAIQRALTDYGYGQLKPTGLIGADTQAAILKFERDRKLPPTGQMSDRLVKELSHMTGRAID